MDEKKCTKCGEVKPLDEFNKRAAALDGRQPVCRACQAARSAAYRAANKDRIAARNAAWNAKNREYKAAWYAANRERMSAMSAERYWANRDEILTANALYRKENADSIRAKDRERYAANRSRARASRRAYQRDNPHIWWASKYRTRARKYGQEILIEDFTKADVVERYGDRCAYCSGPFEELDHFVPIKDGGPHTLANVRPSCVTCNRVKHDKPGDEWLAEQAELDSLTEDELDDLIDAEIERWTN